jgi:hypothetical protein
MIANSCRSVATVALFGLIALLSIGSIASANQDRESLDLTPQQKKDLAAIKKWVDDAGSLFKEKDFKKSGSRIRAAQSRLKKLAETGDKAVLAELKSLGTQVAGKIRRGCGEIGHRLRTNCLGQNRRRSNQLYQRGSPNPDQ